MASPLPSDLGDAGGRSDEVQIDIERTTLPNKAKKSTPQHAVRDTLATSSPLLDTQTTSMRASSARCVWRSENYLLPAHWTARANCITAGMTLAAIAISILKTVSAFVASAIGDGKVLQYWTASREHGNCSSAENHAQHAVPAIAPGPL